MESLDYQQRDRERAREARLVETLREELVDRIARTIRDDGTIEPLPGLHLNRWSSPMAPAHGESLTAFCVVAQGSKDIYLGEDRFRYDPWYYLLSTVKLPVVYQVIDASRERPYLGLHLDLDGSTVGSVMVDAALPSPRGYDGAKAMDVSPLHTSLLEAAVRLVRLVGSPTEARVLMPQITREIVYRLLTGAQGARLRHLTGLGGHTGAIVRAVERLRNDYDKPLRIESLAGDLGMSVSGFHAQFKAVTGMSPLQFQKQMRLQQARRLMIEEDLDALTAGRRVGYDDASHFSREYKRLFSEPPRRDVERLRGAARTTADA
jgi:AraC-like DNA-binding protein